MYPDLIKSQKLKSSKERFVWQNHDILRDEFPSTSLFDRYAESGERRDQMNLLYQDHLTNFVQLRPVTCKCAPEIRYLIYSVYSVLQESYRMIMKESLSNLKSKTFVQCRRV